MLYPTHKRFGLMFGFGLGIIMLSINSYGLFAHTHGFSLFCALLIAILGATFGAEFPDIDKNGTIPTKHHPILRVFFEIFHCEHRGKFSHSYLTQTLFWGGVLLASILFMKIFPPLTVYVSLSCFCTYLVGREVAELSSFLISFFNSDVIKGKNVGAFINFLATQNKQMARKAHYHKLYGSQKIVCLILAIIFGFLFLGNVTNFEFEHVPAPNEFIILKSYLVIYIVFVWFGVMSHLLADMSTYEGVYIGWGERFAPMQIISRFKNVPIIGLFIPDNQFKTGSSWEYGARIFVSSVDIVLFCFLLIQFFVH